MGTTAVAGLSEMRVQATDVASSLPRLLSGTASGYVSS